ncbi:TonB-dependent hemoglobin/transferrin/lactoferrin family receptor [Salmonella enterica]|uniref:TonB-dependent hemoglobin/transferrin/lactoferrin family receptor n=3 Tax=Salmonella enterica TaxID=28901 RepID=A0A635J5X0_SALDZ|nr:TonB-dependent hemoglobin/transferrin/lactoferrin family receptor [Salmonella enterica]ECC3212584.1 TonB-dependent hemoglobin/transferrin/lactoferrin family receptor [Salmonella enterica subsp. diarizonae]EDX6466149.1 TonB-dependent hemoglobin/transferrin/lactoferrin family receptor [Salmonella enterica subsp. diarizonae serovar 60:r:e,n,x,z15]EEG5995971.1 TonB-dependent hemoglobin/transferrin/lactoferrin family receptor [Salmonella enterica subsp. enterica]EGO1766401.1 TonB-dependent hemogl
MMKLPTIHCYPIFVLCMPAFSHASSPAEDTMTITATGTEISAFEAPSVVNVIDNHAAYTRTAFTAGDFLRGIAGITPVGVGRTNGQTFNLRGYDKSGVLVMVDGVRQDSGMDKSSATFLEPALIKKAEVVRGPMSSLYGSGGLGGVISYQTVSAADLLENGRHAGWRIFSSGATGDRSLGGGISAFGRTDNFDGLLSVIKRQRGNIRQSDGGTAPDDEKPGALLAKGLYQFDHAQSLGGSIRLYDNTSEEPGNPTLSRAGNGNPAAYLRHITQRDAQLSYNLHPADQSWLDLETRLYTSDVRIKARPDGRESQNRQSVTYGMKVLNRSEIQTQTTAHHFSWGVEYYQQRHTPSGAETRYPEGKINFYSGLLQDEITLRNFPVSLVTGIRYDHYQSINPQYGELTAGELSPRTALTLSPTEWLTIYGSVSSAFRAPTMEEMYRDGLHFYARGRPNYWVPNPDLKPETNTSQEIGAGLRFVSLFAEDDEFRLKGSYFSTHARNYIATRVDMPGKRTYSYNVPRARIWGWDVQAAYATRWFNWDLSYNRTEGMDDASREWLGTLNPDTVVSTLAFPLPGQGLAAGWRSTFVAPARHVKADAETQPGYALNAFSLDYHLPDTKAGMTASLVLDNAFNQQAYSVQGLPSPGRSLNFFLSYQW